MTDESIANFLCYLCRMYEYNDKELGKIVITPHARAKNVIARKKVGYIQLTVPYGFEKKNLAPVLDNLRPRLMKVESPKNHLITEDAEIRTFSFVAKISRADLFDKIEMSLKSGQLTVFIPQNLDLSLPESQHYVKEMIRLALRHEAKRVLTQKTLQFARKFNLQSQRCEDKPKFIAVGELFASKKHQLFALPDADARKIYRLCGAPRIGAHSGNESQRKVLAIAHSILRRRCQEIEPNAQKASIARIRFTQRGFISLSTTRRCRHR